MKRTIILLSSVLLISCSPYQFKFKQSQFKKEDAVLLNANLTDEIGETVVETVSRNTFEGIKIKTGSKVDDYYSKNNVYEGQILGLMASDEKYDYYFYDTVFRSSGVAIPKDGSPAQYFVNNGFKVNLTKFEKPIVFEKYDYPDVDYKTFKQQLLFNGKSGNELKFTYREYSGDIARPAFTQELQYDLADSNIIGFKGVRLEVIKATNTKIEYKILKGFE